MSSAYTASLLERLGQGSLWAQLAATSLTCRQLGSTCNATECAPNALGDCGLRASWVARQLASPASPSVAGKCGLLGQMMADEATCIELDESSCGFYNGTACSWDLVRNACGVEPASVLRRLRQDQRQRTGPGTSSSYIAVVPHPSKL